jgi:hypothetical protein
VDRNERKAKLAAWKASERARGRAAFPLDDTRLAMFFARVDELFDSEGCDHTPRHAMRAMDELALDDDEANALMEWCRDNGGYCDCEIAANTQEHWSEARG